jgi:hypothetical protein
MAELAEGHSGRVAVKPVSEGRRAGEQPVVVHETAGLLSFNRVCPLIHFHAELAPPG